MMVRGKGGLVVNHLKNLAGNDVALFLFRFVLRGNGIDFVLNEAIAADMYQDVDEKLKPLVHACCETLLRYGRLSVSDAMMDGTILDTGEFEVMLSKGLGRHFADDEKQRLFQDAKHIADLLAVVMDRKTQELKEGKQGGPPHGRSPRSPRRIKTGLQELGQAKRLQAELQWLAEDKRPRPGLKQLRPEDLPSGVTASRGYDHRGHCLIFEHHTLGELGKIVLIEMRDGQILLQAELYQGQADVESPPAKQKEQVFQQVVAIVTNCFNENFSEETSP
jgi:hypothetical protein